jgi:hypothetical protein
MLFEVIVTKRVRTVTFLPIVSQQCIPTMGTTGSHCWATTTLGHASCLSPLEETRQTDMDGLIMVFFAHVRAWRTLKKDNEMKGKKRKEKKWQTLNWGSVLCAICTNKVKSTHNEEVIPSLPLSLSLSLYVACFFCETATSVLIETCRKNLIFVHIVPV